MHAHDLTVGAQPRETIVYVPAMAEGTSAPVVFMLHGSAQTGPQYFNISGWKEKADVDGMIVVFPSALTHCWHDNNGGTLGPRETMELWAAGNLGGPEKPLCTPAEIAALPPGLRASADHPLADDIAFFDAMLAMLAERYVIDERAIYVTGFSNGAQMSGRLAVERSNRVAATAAHAGDLIVSGVAARPLSVVWSVGASDDGYSAGAGLPKLPLTEAELVTLPFFRATVADYARALQLTAAYSYELVTINGKQAARFTFSTSSVGATNTLEMIVIDDLIHTYPNGMNHPVSAPNRLWPFFQSQRLP